MSLDGDQSLRGTSWETRPNHARWISCTSISDLWDVFPPLRHGEIPRAKFYDFGLLSMLCKKGRSSSEPLQARTKLDDRRSRLPH
jgi:hypothetical protein